MNSTQKVLKNQIFFEEISKSIVNAPKFEVIEGAASPVFYNLPTTLEASAFLAAADFLLRIVTSPRAKKRLLNFAPYGFAFDFGHPDLIKATWETERYTGDLYFEKAVLVALAAFKYAHSNNAPRSSIMKLLTLFLAETSKLNKSKKGVVELAIGDVPEGVLEKGRRRRQSFIEAVGRLLTNTKIVVKKRGERGRTYKGVLLNGFEYTKRKIRLVVEKGNSLFAHSVKFLVPFSSEIFKASGVEFNLLLKVLNRARQGSLKISIPLLLDAAGYTKDEARQSRWRVRKIFEADLTSALDRLGWSVVFDGDWALIKTEPRRGDSPKKPARPAPRIVSNAPDFMLGDLEKFDLINAREFIYLNSDFITKSDPSKIPKRPPPKYWHRFFWRALGVILGDGRGEL